jgi:hypothetical protein
MEARRPLTGRKHRNLGSVSGHQAADQPIKWVVYGTDTSGIWVFRCLPAIILRLIIRYMISLRIISGGQTGVDRAALDAALALGIDCGGWCPKGRRAEDGRIADHYPLQETESRDYARRTKANVQDSEGTLIILNDREATVSGGTRLTVKQAEKSDCALLVINVASDATAAVHAIQTVDWIIENQITVLNVAGPRESGSPGIYDAAYNLMTRILADFTRSRS